MFHKPLAYGSAILVSARSAQTGTDGSAQPIALTIKVAGILMNNSIETALTRLVGAAVAMLATLIFLSSATAASNIKFTITGYTPAVDVSSFSIGANRASTATNFQDFVITAPESALTPLLLGWLASGSTRTTATVKIYSPSTGLLLSDWTLTNVQVSSTSLSGSSTTSSSAATLPVAVVSMSYSTGTIMYRVFNPDGTFASGTCWNRATSLTCSVPTAP